MFLVNAGTASTTRLRGNTRPCYNIIEIEDGRVRVFRKYPFKERELAVDFKAETHEYTRVGENVDQELSGDPADVVSGSLSSDSGESGDSGEPSETGS
jgi:hypothetical protein